MMRLNTLGIAHKIIAEHVQPGDLCIDATAGRSNMAQYAQEGSVDCITFNFGYLPGGDHNVFTTPATSIPAIEQGLRLLKPNGLMSLCVYYGGDSGFEEKDALMEYFRTIDSKQYTVLITEFANRPNNPPIPVFILKRI